MYADGPRELQSDGYEAPSFRELAQMAIARLETRNDLSIVCGPISTGGTGNQIYNFTVFNIAVRALEDRGFELFDQIPYEYGLRKLLHKWEHEGNTGYCMPILEEFYAPIFDTGKIARGFFLPTWYTSFGTKWEHRKFVRTDRPRYYFRLSDIDRLLRAKLTPEHADTIMACLCVKNSTPPYQTKLLEAVLCCINNSCYQSIGF